MPKHKAFEFDAELEAECKAIDAEVRAPFDPWAPTLIGRLREAEQLKDQRGHPKLTVRLQGGMQ